MIAVNGIYDLTKSLITDIVLIGLDRVAQYVIA